jgi:hypothetical protein
MAMGPETENDCADECQQRITAAVVTRVDEIEGSIYRLKQEMLEWVDNISVFKI